MASINLPTTTMPGAYPQESGGRLINCFAESLGETAGSSVALRRAPGLVGWGTTNSENFRGMQAVGNNLYSAIGESVYRFSAAGGAGAVLTGSITGTRPVIFARNNKDEPDLVLVVPNSPPFVLSTAAISDYPDAEAGAPNSVTFIKGWFVFSYENGLMRSSGINSTDINTNDYAMAESKPDALYRVIPRGDGQLLAAGSNTIEVWGVNGEDVGFPFSPVTVIPRGIAGRYAICGHEDGFGRNIFFCGDDSAVYELVGYAPTKVSPPDLDRLIEAVADKNDIQMSVFVSMGHAFVVVQTPAWSWVYDTNLKRWHERASYFAPAWRGLMPHNAFGKWLCGDRASGDILEINGASQSEVGQPLRTIVETGPSGSFPLGTRVNRLDLLMSVGVGQAPGIDPIQTDPVVDIQISRDNGVSWSNAWQRRVGPQAIGLQKITVNNMGHCGPQGVKFRFSISDPVHVAIMGGDVEVSARNK